MDFICPREEKKERDKKWLYCPARYEFAGNSINKNHAVRLFDAIGFQIIFNVILPNLEQRRLRYELNKKRFVQWCHHTGAIVFAYTQWVMLNSCKINLTSRTKKRPIDEHITLKQYTWLRARTRLLSTIINNWPVYKGPKFCTLTRRSKEKFLPACVLFSFLRKVCCWRSGGSCCESWGHVVSKSNVAAAQLESLWLNSLRKHSPQPARERKESGFFCCWLPQAGVEQSREKNRKQLVDLSRSGWGGKICKIKTAPPCKVIPWNSAIHYPLGETFPNTNPTLLLAIRESLILLTMMHLSRLLWARYDSGEKCTQLYNSTLRLIVCGGGCCQVQRCVPLLGNLIRGSSLKTFCAFAYRPLVRSRDRFWAAFPVQKWATPQIGYLLYFRALRRQWQLSCNRDCCVWFHMSRARLISALFAAVPIERV